jgi:hypothetical protein
MADGFISGFRSATCTTSGVGHAIREADTDGNDAAVADASWNNLQNTPAVSTIPHAEHLQRRGRVVLAGALGADRCRSRSRRSALCEHKRSSGFRSSRKRADSQVYAGIHFRAACEDGLALGRKIGARRSMYLQPLPKYKPQRVERDDSRLTGATRRSPTPGPRFRPNRAGTALSGLLIGVGFR